MTAHAPRPKRPGPPKRTDKQLRDEMMAVQVAEWESLDLDFSEKVEMIGALLLQVVITELDKCKTANPPGRKVAAKIHVSNALLQLSNISSRYIEANR